MEYQTPCVIFVFPHNVNSSSYHSCHLNSQKYIITEDITSVRSVVAPALETFQDITLDFVTVLLRNYAVLWE